jgi:hypothetical protein
MCIGENENSAYATCSTLVVSRLLSKRNTAAKAHRVIDYGKQVPRRSSRKRGPKTGATRHQLTCSWKIVWKECVPSTTMYCYNPPPLQVQRQCKGRETLARSQKVWGPVSTALQFVCSSIKWAKWATVTWAALTTPPLTSPTTAPARYPRWPYRTSMFFSLKKTKCSFRYTYNQNYDLK